MDDLIYRSAALRALGERPLAWNEGEYELGLQNQWESDVDAIKNVPPAQSEREKGKWNKVMRITETKDCVSYTPVWYCGHCGKAYDSHIAQLINFCFNCGADMRGEQKRLLYYQFL